MGLRPSSNIPPQKNKISKTGSVSVIRSKSGEVPTQSSCAYIYYHCLVVYILYTVYIELLLFHNCSPLTSEAVTSFLIFRSMFIFINLYYIDLLYLFYIYIIYLLYLFYTYLYLYYVILLLLLYF
jgi:hypothetical protein